MAPQNVFFVGATGYIGGTIFDTMYNRHSDLKYDVLVRTKEKGEKVKAQYPNVNIIIGDLDSSDILISAAEKADIVITTADCDHQQHVKDIYKGMAKHNGTAYYIHTSGTGILMDPKSQRPGFAKQSEISDKDYDDIKDVAVLTSLPDEQLHRLVDRIVLEQAPLNVKHAIIAPPIIYGKGTGPANQNSIQIPELVRTLAKKGHPFTINGSENVWSGVHVVDLADVYCYLVLAALENGGKADWGKEGYYFAESEKLKWGDIYRATADIMYDMGKIKSKESKDYTGENINKELGEMLPMLTGSNSISTASRAKERFGWKPKQPKAMDTLRETIEMTLAN